MVVNNHVHVLRSVYNKSLRLVVQLGVWVDVYYFPVTPAFEQKSGLVICHQLEIFRNLRRYKLRVPIVEGQVRRAWQQFFLAAEILTKIICLETMPVIYVPAYFLSSVIFVSDKNYASQLSLAD